MAARDGSRSSEDIMHMTIELGYWLSLACTVIWGS
jgi:hypothetical protein